MEGFELFERARDANAKLLSVQRIPQRAAPEAEGEEVADAADA